VTAKTPATSSSAPTLARHTYLRPSDLHRLRQLQFVARQRVDGAYAGRHASSRRGHSVEFKDYRPYMPGDDVADIDWKVYGRSDKLLIKLFEHHTDMNVHLLVDGSASMQYAGELTGDTYTNHDERRSRERAGTFTRLRNRIGRSANNNRRGPGNSRRSPAIARTK